MVVALIDDFDKLAAMIDSSGMGWAVVVGIVSMYGCSVARTGAPTRVRRAAHSAHLFFFVFCFQLMRRDIEVGSELVRKVRGVGKDADDKEQIVLHLGQNLQDETSLNERR